MASKWKNLVGKLDPFALEPTYQARIDEEKKSHAALSPSELARKFKITVDEKEQYEQDIKDCNLQIEAISQLIVSALEASDLQSIELESGMKCGLRIEPYVSILDTNEARALYDKFIHSKNMKCLLTLNAQTRNGYVKQLLEAGRPAPAWAKVFIRTSAKLLGKSKENQPGGNSDE